MDHFTVAVLVSQNPRPANNQGPEKFKEKIHKIKSSPKEGFKAIYLIAVYKEPIGAKLESLSFLF